MTVLQFINKVRGAIGLPPAVAFDPSPAKRGSESECLLALAMGCVIGAASHPEHNEGVAELVMVFPSVEMAQTVAAATGCRWCDPLTCVLLPDALADIAARFDLGDTIDSSAWVTTSLPAATAVAA